ncbi:hypothetical protein KPB2_5553 [Klebsiella pneumoniae Kb677]|nr:hypothetical protein KPB2_5553 [Klebsiella pneumoniae Kb677]
MGPYIPRLTPDCTCPAMSDLTFLSRVRFVAGSSCVGKSVETIQ